MRRISPHITGRLSRVDAQRPVTWRQWPYAGLSRALLVERDGVVSRIAQHAGSGRGEAVEEIFVNAVRPIVNANIPLILICAARREYGALRRITARRDMSSTVSALRARDIPVQAFVCCPHLPVESCTCAKPEPGLILACRDQFHVVLEKSVYLGGSIADLETGARAGIRTELVRTDTRLDYFKSFSAAFALLAP